MSNESRVEISDYPNVKIKAEELGCQIPTQLALLPTNFDTATSKGGLLHEREALTVRAIFRRAQIGETPIENVEERIPQLAHNAFEDWIGPIIFFSYSALTQNPLLLNLSLGVIANYLTDIFKGLSANRGVKLTIVVEKENGTCKKVQYQGPVNGLAGVADIVQGVVQNE